jgi:nucleoside-diphosphate-sugar epimerase
MNLPVFNASRILVTCSAGHVGGALMRTLGAAGPSSRALVGEVGSEGCHISAYRDAIYPVG